MSKLLKLTASVNKKNKQITTSFKKSDLPKKLLDIIKKNPRDKRILHLKFEGFE